MVKIATVSKGGFKLYMTGINGKPFLWASTEQANIQIALWEKQNGKPKNFHYIIEPA